MLIGSGLGAQTPTGSRGHVRLPVTALVASSVITVAGCSGGTSLPRSLPPLHSATPPARHEPRSTSTTHRPVSERAAVALAVRHYYDVANNLRHDMRADGLAALFTRDCPCRAQARAVRRAARLGEHYIDHAHINALRANLDGPGIADVLSDVNTSRGGLRSQDGGVVTSVPATRHLRRDFRLERVHGQWLIDQIDQL